MPEANDIAWSADGTLLAACGSYGRVTSWPATGGQARHLEGHTATENVRILAWHPSLSLLVTASNRGDIRYWAVDMGTSRVFRLSSAWATTIAWSPNGRSVAVGSIDGGISTWEPHNGTQLQHTQWQDDELQGLCWSHNGNFLIAGSGSSLSVISAKDLRLEYKLSGHTGQVLDVALSPDARLAASVSADSTVRVWDLARRTEVAVLEGHTGIVGAVQFSPDGKFLASGSAAGPADGIRLWRCRDWECVAFLLSKRLGGYIRLALHPKQPLLAAIEFQSRQVDWYKIDYALLDSIGAGPGSRRYANAKVVLLGDSGVGKSGLGLVLSGQAYRATDSTHGRNVWTVTAEDVRLPGGGTQAREVLLWDLAGQPGYRIIHQLHLNEVAVALIVFDSRSETDPFAGVKYWARALAQARRLAGAAAVPLKTYLVAARVDRGGVAVSADRIRAMVRDLGLDGFFETSAKEGWQVTELTEAIRDSIDWDALPTISSSVLFDSIKGFLVEEKGRGRLLCAVDDLFHGFGRAHPDEAKGDGLRASFETCIGRVESRGLIRRLHFGDLVLLQPELLDAYASGMVQAAREEPDGLGLIAEDDALAGRFRLGDSERVDDEGQERLLLIATVEELLRHEIALKQVTDQGVELVFPSQFTRERPDAPDIPGREVTFGFEGPVHHIYATLAVRLSHSRLFGRRDMWQNAASYTAADGGVCGIHLRELQEGRGELVLFYDRRAGRVVRSQFETYVEDHVRLRALPGTLTRRAIRACSNCGYVLPEELVRRRLDRGAATVRCPDCEETVIALAEEPAAPADGAVAEMNRSADERRDRGAAELRLKGKVETGDYDVFLCHNSRDKEQVKAIGERLKERGILPWLDVWAIPPGSRWQKELHRSLKSVRSAAVFIGQRGPGPWQELEVESLLAQITKRNRPIIPVILQGREGTPRLPEFLKLWQVVDMRQPQPDPFEQLVWGITGERSPRL